MKHIFILIFAFLSLSINAQNQKAGFSLAYGETVVAFTTMCDLYGNEYDKCKLSDGTSIIVDSNGNEVSGANGSTYTLYSKITSPHADAASYGSTFTYRGQVTSGNHPTIGGSITNYAVYSVCSESLPPVDLNNHIWISGSPSSFTGVSFTDVNSDVVCSGLNISEKFCKISVVCKKACSKGVSIDVVIGYDGQGNVAWYRDENGDEISKPDFDSTCPEKECNTISQTLCADGDYTGINDGDAIILTLLSCNDGSSSVLGGALLTDPTTSITLPNNIVFKTCDNDIETELIDCTEDDKGVRWNVILINGTTIAYQNQSDNSFGTPSGNTIACIDPIEFVSTWPDRYCIKVGLDTLEAIINVASDKTICASVVDGKTTYKEGDYTIVSCCPDATPPESPYISGFEVERPLPNTSWNNQVIINPPVLQGDFNLCSTILAEDGNTPNMVGINSDPNTNANYNTIDCALYFYNAGSTYLLRDYRNGAYNGQYSSGSWVGTEFCYNRIGGDLFYSINGVVVNASNPCPIGTGDVYLDDSHYYLTSGTWSQGSVTYDDFVLKNVIDETIKVVGECDDFCEKFEIVDNVFSLENVTGTLRSRQWDLGINVLPNQITIAQGAAIIDAFDFTATTTLDADWSNLGVRDANGSNNQDAQVIEGYVVVSENALIRYNTPSSGYFRLEVGECGEPLETKIETSTISEPSQAHTYTYPIGIHKIRMWNIDDWASTFRDLEYSTDGGVTWITDNNPPMIQLSREEPKENCKKLKECEGDNVAIDYLTGEVIDKSKCYLKSIDCVETPILCEVFEYFSIGNATNSFRSREWDLTTPMQLSSTIEDFRNVRENFDFTASTTFDNDITSFFVNETNNSQTVTDAQVIEMYIVADEDVKIRFTGGSWGYLSVEVGECCGDMEVVIENRMSPSASISDEYLVKRGIHSYRVFNIDDFGDSSRSMQYWNGTTWVTDNNPPMLRMSKTKPVELCRKIKECEGSSIATDYETGDIVDKADLYKKSIECQQSCSINITN